MGDRELRVVYGKLGGAVPHTLMQHIEQRLVARFGPLAWEPRPSCA